MSSDEAVGLALASREVSRLVDTWTITDLSALMLYNAALDNSHLLPPFSPVGFNEDGLFGHFLRICDPEAFIGQIPYCIDHDSPRPSLFPLDWPLAAWQIRLAELTKWLTSDWAATHPSTDPSQRTTSLGDHLLCLGSLPRGEFRRLVQRTVLETKSRVLHEIEGRSSIGGSSDAWRAACNAYRETLLRSMVSDEALVPMEFRGSGTTDDQMVRVQAHLLRFGEALHEWPELWSFAARHPDLLGGH